MTHLKYQPERPQRDQGILWPPKKLKVPSKQNFISPEIKYTLINPSRDLLKGEDRPGWDD